MSDISKRINEFITDRQESITRENVEVELLNKRMLDVMTEADSVIRLTPSSSIELSSLMEDKRVRLNRIARYESDIENAQFFLTGEGCFS